MHALIVEDNAAFRETLKAMLGGRYPLMEVTEAESGEEAMDRLRTTVPDLIFVDIKLPGINGLDLTREIRALYPSPKITVLTSYDLPEYREAAFRNGADHFMSKGTASVAEIAALVEACSREIVSGGVRGAAPRPETP